jgi:hypothetical protein
MAPLAIWLLAIGIADCVSGFSGQIDSIVRALLGSTCGGLVTFALTTLLRYNECTSITTTLVFFIGVLVWSLGRTGSALSTTRSTLGLVYFCLATLFIAGAVTLWPTTSPAQFSSWLAKLPYPSLHAGYATVLLSASAIVFFLGTSNAIVRLVLGTLHDNVPPSAQPLRGGRAIGPLERILIFGLALAGDPTAVALVISAKSLLRFPEITRQAPERIDSVTEYFLVGSLSSWTLALAFVPLIHT